MAEQWVDVPLDAKLFLNIDEASLTRAQAALENAYHNEAGGLSRFPGLKSFATLSDNGRAYLTDFRGDLMAATSKGRVYRINEAATVTDVTGVPITGGGRVIFDETEDYLLMAAGGQIIRFDGDTTTILSENAPLTTHIGTIDSFVLAIEKNSGRFFHSDAGAPSTWNALSTFAADGRPDDIVAMLITQFREVMLFGSDSIEQFERLSSGTVPFFRRWAIGDGLSAPYCTLFTDNAVFCLNRAREFVRLSGQTSEPVGDDIGKVLEAIDDWTDAWVGGYPDNPLNIVGQRFILLQAPKASNPYGTVGRTFVLDYRKRRWFEIYGWDAAVGRPTRWPGWSHWKHWDRTFVGGEGAVYEIDTANHNNVGVTQRFLVRTAHISELGEVAIENLRLRVKRGVGTYVVSPTISVRCNRDNRGWSNWVRKGLGKTGAYPMNLEFGSFGHGHAFQFEVEVTDDCQVELVKMQVLPSSADH